MKSNSDDSEVGINMRKEEATQLLTGLASLDGAFKPEKDIVLLGDANITRGEFGVHKIWTNFIDLNSNETLTWMNPGYVPPAPRGYAPAPFDRIFVPKNQPEFKEARFHVHAPTSDPATSAQAWVAQHKKLRSDHLLIWCDLQVTDDDD